MKFRWTIEDCQTLTDTEILRGLVAERKSELNPYSPFAKRLTQISDKLDQEIQRKKEAT